MASPTGNEVVTVQGVDGAGRPSGQTENFTTLQISSVLAFSEPPVVQSNVTVVGNATLSGANIVGGYIIRSGPVAPFADKTDTAANIIAAWGPSAYVGLGYPLLIQNSTAVPSSLTGNTGVSFSTPYNNIPANSEAIINVTFTSLASVTMAFMSSAYNNFVGYDPSTVQTQFGSGVGTFLEEGNINRQVFGIAATPANITNDYVIAVYSLPANSFDGIGNRGLSISAAGNFAATTNNKTAKIIFNPSVASVGNPVVGGTTLMNTSVVTNSAVGWYLQAQVYKYGAGGSNTQYGQGIDGSVGNNNLGVSLSSTITAVENAAINICVTGNAATITNDILLNFFATNVMN
jgi:hypothetical protein